MEYKESNEYNRRRGVLAHENLLVAIIILHCGLLADLQPQLGVGNVQYDKSKMKILRQNDYVSSIEQAKKQEGLEDLRKYSKNLTLLSPPKTQTIQKRQKGQSKADLFESSSTKTPSASRPSPALNQKVSVIHPITINQRMRMGVRSLLTLTPF